jgi:hypothetical protein
VPSLSWYAQNRVLDALIRGVPLVTPPTLYIALVTTAGANNFLSGVEIIGGSYARAVVPSTLAAWAGTQGQGSTGISIGLGGHTSNNTDIRFPDPTSNWGSVVAWEAWDQPTFGTRWLYDNLQVPKTISVGDSSIIFPAGELQISFV